MSPRKILVSSWVEKSSLLLQRSLLLPPTTSVICCHPILLRNQRQLLNKIPIRNFSTKGGGGSKGKRPRLGDNGSSKKSGLDGVWYTTKKPPSSSTNLDMGKFGLKRLDYSTIEVPVWTIPPHPPSKSLADRIIFPATLLIVAGFMVWVYMNPEEDDMTEYWKRVERGQVLIDDSLDDDDEDWDDDDDDDEEE